MNIYVSNLSFKVDNESLKKHFTAFGEVSSANIITDKVTSRSRGFAFVEMPNDEEAQTAIKELNGTSIDGRSIQVNEARPREDKPRNASSFGNRW